MPSRVNTPVQAHHRQSTRLSSARTRTRRASSSYSDSVPPSTAPTSAGPTSAFGPKCGRRSVQSPLEPSPVVVSNARQKRAADDDQSQPVASRPTKRTRRENSNPAAEAKPKVKPSRTSTRKNLKRSRYFDNDEDVEKDASEDASSAWDSEPVAPKVSSKGKGRASQPSKPSKGKGKGKTRLVDPESSEAEVESADEPLSKLSRLSSKKGTHSRRPKTANVESGTEEEILQAVMKLSKDEYTRQNGLAAASSSRPKRTISKPSRLLVADDAFVDDSNEDPDFEDVIKTRRASSLSSLTSQSESDASDSNSDTPITRPSSASRKRSPRKRRSRQPDKSTRGMTWWQRNQVKLERHHPELIDIWGDLTQKVKVVEPSKAEQPDGLSLTLLPFQLEGLDWMKKQERGPWSGGMLADEMGMGKTIQTIALILSDWVPGSGKQTLVIAPTVAIMQWRNEIDKFAKGLSVNVWHGGNRSSDQAQMKSFDVVLTSFAVLESTFRRQHSGFKRKGELLKEPSLLHKVKWHRVILDEAHNIKDRSSNTAKGAFELTANYKWCLSGTPLQNRVGELYSLIRFLGADPFAYYFCKSCDCKKLHWAFSDRRTCDDCHHSPMQHVCFWNNEILKPVQKYGASVEGSHGHTAFNKLKVLLDRMMLRRTKLERADDLGLPPRAVLVRRDYFTEEEEELYSSLYSDVTRKFCTYADAGTVLNNYGNIFQLITRMRQMSDHPDLVLKSKAAQAAFKGIKSTKEDDADPTSIHTCRICLDEAEDAIISRCRHIFCRECIRQYLETASEQEPECPVCHLPITIDLSQDCIDDGENLGSKARQGVLDRLDPGKWRTSTKIEALVEELSKLNQQDHTIKSLVFSQFTVFLDLIERRLQLAGFKLARLQGNMTPEARDRTIQYFMNNNDVQVFLVSLKAGGVALNLTEASRVFIMDPWWNPAVELQAMDRIHRLGQHRPVIVTRLIIENSIESRIVELQKKKEAMTGAALGDDDQALGRLTPEDLSFLFTL